MSPPGHAAVSYLLGRSVRWVSLPAVVVGGILPDIDFVLLPFPWFNQIHRVATHNLWFVLIVGVVGVLFARAGRRAPVFLGLLLGGLCHLLVDASMDSNPSNGIGVALFWPVSNWFFSPFNLVTPSADAPTWDNPGSVFSGFLARGLMWELPVWLLAGFLWWRGGIGRRKTLAENTPAED